MKLLNEIAEYFWEELKVAKREKDSPLVIKKTFPVAL